MDARKTELKNCLKVSNSLGPFEDKRDYFATSVLSESINLNFDSEGRVSIPDKLLKHAKIRSSIYLLD